MTGLRNLRCRLDLHYRPLDEPKDLNSKAEWVQPILEVRGLKNFDMAIIVNGKFGERAENSVRAEEFCQYLRRTCTRPSDDE